MRPGTARNHRRPRWLKQNLGEAYRRQRHYMEIECGIVSPSYLSDQIEIDGTHLPSPAPAPTRHAQHPRNMKEGATVQRPKLKPARPESTTAPIGWPRDFESLTSSEVSQTLAFLSRIIVPFTWPTRTREHPYQLELGSIVGGASHPTVSAGPQAVSVFLLKLLRVDAAVVQ